jgi:homoserine O-acetyltransferase/O-succinyltransferase
MTQSPSCFTLKNFVLQCGATLDEAQIVYQTYGTLNRDRSNVILYPTSYGAQHSDLDWLIRPDGILDPTQWFIVIPNLFGNGLSTSPSNHNFLTEEQWFSHFDNVTAQRKLLEDVFQIEQLALVYGWSMGAQQAYHWGALYPDRVQRIAALCGTARTTDHNRIFLQSLRTALTADPEWNGTRFEAIPDLCQLGCFPGVLPGGYLLHSGLFFVGRLSRTSLGIQLSQARSAQSFGND